LLSDTVGFINELPTDLVNAFHSTLEEALYADLILEVVDSSDPNHLMHSEVTEKTLAQLGAGGIPRITVMNKAESLENIQIPKIMSDKVYISAKQGIGITELVDLIEKKLDQNLNLCTLRIPYAKSGLESNLRNSSKVIDVEYENDSIVIKAYLDDKHYGLYKEYLVT
jgi:GTP-binding protein HflX